ncbi:MAG: acyltransferase family protein [Bacteroidales bacterium]|nr:acyltransferase family protein [Bacteroidales bacterium]
MKTGSERQAWLDYVRFFSIFLVIVFHTPPRLEIFDDAVILNLRVPVFFCISGFLYSFDRWPRFSSYVRHRAKQILVPYCTFFVIFYALWLLVGRKMVGAQEEAISVWQPVLEFVTGNPQTVVAPFWYIACLFTMQLLYWLIERCIPRNFVLPTCIVLALATYLIPFEIPEVVAIGHFWNIDNALLFLPFYALGNKCKGALTRLQFHSPRNAAFVVAMAAASVAIMVESAPVRSDDPQLYRLLRIAAGFMVIPCYFCVAKWVASKCGHRRVIEFVVVSGTVYLGLQNYFIGIAKILLGKAFHPGIIDEHIWLKYLIAIVVMAAIYPAAWAIDRYAPWLLGKQKSHL